MGEVYLLNLYPQTLTFQILDPNTGNVLASYTLAPNQYVDITSVIPPGSNEVEVYIPNFGMSTGIGLYQSSVQTIYFNQSGIWDQPTSPQQMLQSGSQSSTSTSTPTQSSSTPSSSSSSQSSSSASSSSTSSSTPSSSTGEVYLLNLYPSTLVFNILDPTTGNVLASYTLAPNQYVDITSIIPPGSDDVEIEIPAFYMTVAQVLLQSSVQTIVFNQAGLGDEPTSPQQILQGISSSTSSQSQSSTPSSSSSQSSTPSSSSTSSTSSSPPSEIYLLNLSPNTVTITVTDLTTGNSQTYTLVPNQYVDITSVISSLSDEVEIEVPGVGSFNIGLFQSPVQTIYFDENTVGDTPYSPQQILQSVSSSSSQNNSSSSTSTPQSTPSSSSSSSSSSPSSSTSQSTSSQGSAPSSSQSNNSAPTPPPSSSTPSSSSSSQSSSSASSSPSSSSQSSTPSPSTSTQTSTPASQNTSSQSSTQSSSSAPSSSTSTPSSSSSQGSAPSSSQSNNSAPTPPPSSSTPSSSSSSQSSSSASSSASTTTTTPTSSTSTTSPQTSESPSSPTASQTTSTTPSPFSSIISQSQVLAQIKAGDLSSLQSEIAEIPPSMIPLVTAVTQLYQMYDIPNGTPLSTAVERLLSDIRDAYYKISNHKQEEVNTQQLSQLLQIYNTLVSNGLAPQSQSASKLGKLVKTSGTIPALPAVLGQYYPGNVYNSNGTYSNFV